jgi:hypothetical protein
MRFSMLPNIMFLADLLVHRLLRTVVKLGLRTE